MLILALDLGLSKSAVCVMDSETNTVKHGTCRTRARELTKLFERETPELIVVEISPLAAMVHDLAVRLGIQILVADTTQDAWRWRNVKRKTDRDDALKLARLAAVGGSWRISCETLRSIRAPCAPCESARSRSGPTSCCPRCRASPTRLFAAWCVNPAATPSDSW